MKSDDQTLLEAARRGEGKALDELLARHEQQIYRFGLRMCGNQDDAREVLQETLLAAFKSLPEFRGDAALSTWLYQIARSFCIKSRRPSSGAVPDAVPLDRANVGALESAEAGPDARAHAKEIGSLLQAGILALPANQREALVLRDVEGLTAEEAAQVVGIDVRALKSRLHRARVALRQSLAGVLEANESEGPPPCPELAEALSDYAGADIDQATCVRIEEHLSTCPRCSASCDSLKRTVSLCRQLPGGEVPPPVRAAVRQAIMGARRR